jgi:hypothetical protein
MTVYSKTSPYYGTVMNQGYLDVMTFRDFQRQEDDIEYEVTKNYENRPDLLAFDLYGDVNLWWVFAMRNPNVIKDSVYDLKSGIKIFLPKLSTLKRDLGI